MDNDNKKYSDFAEELKETISDAIGSKNYEKLSKNVSNIINGALDMGAAGINKAKKSMSAVSDAVKAAVNNKKGMPINKSALPSGYGVVPFLFGTMGAVSSLVVFGIGTLGFAITEHLIPALVCGAVALAGGIGFGRIGRRGSKKMKLRKAFKRYTPLLKGKDFILIEEISRSTGTTAQTVAEDMDTLIKAGAFPEGHIAPDLKYFLGTNEVYNVYLDSMKTMQERKERLENDPQYEKLVKALEDGREHIRKIRHANDLIADADISKKLDDMEMIVDRIFDRIEDKPELLPEIRKLLEYYLPMTQKLLEAYIELGGAQELTENAKNSMDEIEKSLDMINTAFFNLYNDMFHADKIDIKSDIDTLRTMFAQEGLNGSDFDINKLK